MNEFDKTVIRLYNEEDCSTYEIAKKLDTYPNKIRRTLKKHKIPLKDKSQAQRIALQKGRSSHPTEGKKRSLEERVKISQSLENYWGDMSDLEKKRRAKQAKDNWQNMSASQRESMRSKGIAAIRAAAKEGSKLEKFFEKRLTEAGFRVQLHKLLIPSENLEIDLYIPGLETIIEVDGPSHFLPIWGQDKLDKQINADLRKTGTLLTKGYVVIRVKSLGQESVAKREQMIESVINILNKLKTKKPNRKNRFIEVE
tara:strand:- start:145 stop:909 length:765 start_codon:yes stop_codon:yes gene_type:complete